ncbi:MAG: hypothetical protein ACFFHD_06610 [Promethearchaeota archaeon]
MKKIKLDEKKRKILIGILFTSLNFLVAVLIPLVILMEFYGSSEILDINIDDFLYRLEQGTVYLVIIGSLITFFILLTYFQKPFTNGKLIFSLIPEILYIFYIILASQMQNYFFNVQDVKLVIDFSNVYLSLLGVPILVMIRILHNFMANINDFKINLTILIAIKKSNKLKTKKQVKNYILNNIDSDNKLKDKLIHNFSKYFTKLEKDIYIRKKNRYVLTLKGNILVQNYENRQRFNLLKSKFIEILPTTKKVPLQVWTEKDLEKSSQT